MNKYTDIIHLSRPKSKHPSMSLNNRSFQFAPFSALTGYEEKIKETARITSSKIDLEEDAKIKLNDKLGWLKENINRNPEVTITYFVADKKKSGGSYQKVTGNIRRIDEVGKCLVFMDKTKVFLDDIIKVEGNIFCDLLLVF